jgi:hypothetical protein
MAIWMSNKLPGMCIEEGRCFNDACCGCRFWGQGGFNENLTYVSFEKVEGDFLPIMVHPDFHLLKLTYGNNGSSFTSSMKVNTPFLPHIRVKKVFLKAFSSYDDREVLELPFQQAEERGGGDISHKLRKEVDLKHASPGVFVSKNGKFAEQGGVLGVDFFNCISIHKAATGNLINSGWGKRPNQRRMTQKIIRENMNNRGECFIPWSHSEWIAGYEVTGTLIKFSGYVHTCGNTSKVGATYPSEEI